MKPLMAIAGVSPDTGFTKEQIFSLFSNVEEFLPINKQLLVLIQERINSWDDNQLLGDIFLKLVRSIYHLPSTTTTSCILPSYLLHVHSMMTLHRRHSSRPTTVTATTTSEQSRS